MVLQQLNNPIKVPALGNHVNLRPHHVSGWTVLCSSTSRVYFVEDVNVCEGWRSACEVEGGQDGVRRGHVLEHSRTVDQRDH